jgi:hypothetical protein
MASQQRLSGEDMGDTDKKKKPQAKAEDKTKRSPAPREEDQDYEVGDIATPEPDRYGTDDEPL